MFETVYYETDRNLRGTGIFVVLVSLYAVFAVALFPSFEAAAVDLEELVKGYPEPVRHAFGIEAIGTIEGFLAGEFYNFVWVLLLGLYFAYRAGGMIAADIERDRMDLLLSFPVSRSRLLLEKFASLLVPILALNIGVELVIYGGVLSIGEAIDPISLTMAHLLSIPYLATCASIGLVLSVVVDRADIAQRGALGLVFALYLVESLAASAEGFEALQYVSPTYYYDPTTILVRETYAIGDAGLLVVATVGLLLLSQSLFKRRDI